MIRATARLSMSVIFRVVKEDQLIGRIGLAIILDPESCSLHRFSALDHAVVVVGLPLLARCLYRDCSGTPASPPSKSGWRNISSTLIGMLILCLELASRDNSLLDK